MLEKECNRDDFERNRNKMSFPKVGIGNLPRLSFSQARRNGGCVEYLRLQALGMTTDLNNVPLIRISSTFPLMGKAPSTLRERAECVSTGVRGKLSHGFTLIELIVVVLIIGILAAVALPQYQKAVEKSRATEAINLLEYIQKVYKIQYLEDPHAVPSLKEVAEFSGVLWEDENSFCSKYFYYILEYPDISALRQEMSAETCEFDSEKMTYALDRGLPDGGGYEDYKGCNAYTPFGSQVCQSLGFTPHNYY